MSGWWLVRLPLWKIMDESSQLGWCSFPTEWKVIKYYKIHVPNHQSEYMTPGPHFFWWVLNWLNIWLLWFYYYQKRHQSCEGQLCHYVWGFATVPKFNIWLVVQCNNHLEKYEFVNGKNYPIYYGKNVWNHQPDIL